MNISINIPSYKRPSSCDTLKYLPFANVWVDNREADEYRKNYPNANIIACPDGVQGCGVPRVRNYIMDTEFGNGADVVVIMDDDMQYLERYDRDENNYGYKRTKLLTEEFLFFIEKYSIMCKDLGAYFWGVNINTEPLGYFHFAPIKTNCYIGGPFQVFVVNAGGLRYDESIPLKEDYDMTLQQLNKYRRVLRLDFYHYICKQSENRGGCAAIRNRKVEEENIRLLTKKWGSKIVKLDKTKDNDKEKFADYNPIIKIPIKGI